MIALDVQGGWQEKARNAVSFDEGVNDHVTYRNEYDGNTTTRAVSVQPTATNHEGWGWLMSPNTITANGSNTKTAHVPTT